MGRLHIAGCIPNCLIAFFLQDAMRNGLVCTEVLMWFYIGECIGKGGLIGYAV